MHFFSFEYSIGTLATRLLALRYGADLVYSEEIIDFKLLRTYRYENGKLKFDKYKILICNFQV